MSTGPQFDESEVRAVSLQRLMQTQLFKSSSQFLGKSTLPTEASSVLLLAEAQLPALMHRQLQWSLVDGVGGHISVYAHVSMGS